MRVTSSVTVSTMASAPFAYPVSRSLSPGLACSSAAISNSKLWAVPQSPTSSSRGSWICSGAKPNFLASFRWVFISTAGNIIFAKSCGCRPVFFSTSFIAAGKEFIYPSSRMNLVSPQLTNFSPEFRQTSTISSLTVENALISATIPELPTVTAADASPSSCSFCVLGYAFLFSDATISICSVSHTNAESTAAFRALVPPFSEHIASNCIYRSRETICDRHYSSMRFFFIRCRCGRKIYTGYILPRN